MERCVIEKIEKLQDFDDYYTNGWEVAADDVIEMLNTTVITNKSLISSAIKAIPNLAIREYLIERLPFIF